MKMKTEYFGEKLSQLIKWRPKPSGLWSFIELEGSQRSSKAVVVHLEKSTWDWAPPQPIKSEPRSVWFQYYFLKLCRWFSCAAGDGNQRDPNQSPDAWTGQGLPSATRPSAPHHCAPGTKEHSGRTSEDEGSPDHCFWVLSTTLPTPAREGYPACFPQILGTQTCSQWQAGRISQSLKGALFKDCANVWEGMFQN